MSFSWGETTDYSYTSLEGVVFPTLTPATDFRWMKPQNAEEFHSIFLAGIQLAKSLKAHALLVMLEEPADWNSLKTLAAGEKVVIASDQEENIEGAIAAGMATILVDIPLASGFDKISHVLLEAISEERIVPGARVVVLYSGFDGKEVDSISVIDLGDHLGRLTVRDLRQLETRVPLDTLQTVVNLAVEIGREGREGKPVGTLFVVGDTPKVRKLSRTVSFDPVKGYSRKERNLKLSRVREGIKEIAQMDGAILVGADGTVEAAAQYLDAPATNVSLTKGMGARHWAAASISKASKAIAVAVSESSGTVRIFQNGEIILRIEPFRRPMKWKGQEFEPAPE